MNALISSSLTADQADASEQRSDGTTSSRRAVFYQTVWSGALTLSRRRLFWQRLLWQRLLWQRQPALAAIAAVFLLAALPTSVAMQLDARTVNEISIWVKPTKFLVSLSLFYATLAWNFGLLPASAQLTRAGRFIIWGSIGVGVDEMVWLLAAAVAGVPAHFNRQSFAWSVAYSSAGVGATTLLVAMLWQARMIAKNATNTVSPVLRAGVVVGAYTAFVMTLITAFVLAAGSGHWIGGPASDASGLPLLGWARNGGDLRVPHFFALHAQQFLPLAAWIVGDKLGWLSEARSVRVLAVLYVLIVMFTFVQALHGVPFIS